MRISYTKKFKKVEFYIQLGIGGKLTCYGDLSEDYKKFKDDEEFLKDRGYYEDHSALMYTPAIYSTSNSVWDCLIFCWLFIYIQLSNKNKVNEQTK